MVKYICVIVLLAAIIVSPGCEEYEYIIEMTPDGGSIKRTISFSNNLPEEQKQAISKFYPERIDINTFSGTFSVELPNDVGGAGFYTCLVTSMGSTSIYKERFQGDDDLNKHIEDIGVFVDRYVDFTISWLEFEIGKEPNFGRVRTFLDGKLRTDARNIGLYFWLGGVIEQYDSNASTEMKLRVVHYLEEKGYIVPGQADILMEQSDRGGEEEILKLVRDIVARQMGWCNDGEDSNKLAFLASTDTIKSSIDRYIKSTERYRQMWEEEKINKDDVNLPPPDVDIQDFITEDAPIPFDFDLWPTTYKVNVRLKCPQRPFETNGQWQNTNNQVFWSDHIEGEDDLPTFFYAKWSEPNNDFQQRHFGRIILEGKNLAEYCCWGKSIEAEQTRQWNEFISGIDPNTEIGTIVKSFRFTGESAEPNAPTLADVPRTLIINALSQQ